MIRKYIVTIFEISDGGFVSIFSNLDRVTKKKILFGLFSKTIDRKRISASGVKDTARAIKKDSQGWSFTVDFKSGDNFFLEERGLEYRDKIIDYMEL